MAKTKGFCNDCGGLINACCHTDPEPFGDGRDKGIKSSYCLTEQQGKAVQEVLRRYANELEEQRRTDDLTGAVRMVYEEDHQLAKDIDYVTELAKLFD